MPDCADRPRFRRPVGGTQTSIWKDLPNDCTRNPRSKPTIGISAIHCGTNRQTMQNIMASAIQHLRGARRINEQRITQNSRPMTKVVSVSPLSITENSTLTTNISA